MGAFLWKGSRCNIPPRNVNLEQSEKSSCAASRSQQIPRLALASIFPRIAQLGLPLSWERWLHLRHPGIQSPRAIPTQGAKQIRDPEGTLLKPRCLFFFLFFFFFGLCRSLQTDRRTAPSPSRFSRMVGTARYTGSNRKACAHTTI